MRQFLFSLLLSLPFWANAQSKIHIEPVFGVFQTNFSAEPEPTVGATIPKKIKQHDGQVGVLFSKKIWRKTSVVAGLLLARNPAKYSCDCLQWPSEHDGNGGYLPDKSLDDFIQLKNTYLEIPLLVRRRFGSRRVQPFAEIGLSPAFLIKAKRESFGIFSIGNYDDLKPKNSVQLAGQLAVGVSAKLGAKHALALTVFYKPYLTQLVYPYQKMRFSATGLQLGFQF